MACCERIILPASSPLNQSIPRYLGLLAGVAPVAPTRDCDGDCDMTASASVWEQKRCEVKRSQKGKIPPEFFPPLVLDETRCSRLLRTMNRPGFKLWMDPSLGNDSVRFFPSQGLPPRFYRFAHGRDRCLVTTCQAPILRSKIPPNPFVQPPGSRPVQSLAVGPAQQLAASRKVCHGPVLGCLLQSTNPSVPASRVIVADVNPPIHQSGLHCISLDVRHID